MLFPVKQLSIIILLSSFCFSNIKAEDKKLDWQNIANYDTSMFDLSTKEGLWKAQLKIGTDIADKATFNADIRKAKYWYEQAAESGSTEAMFQLAMFYNAQPDAAAKSINAQISLNWLQKAAKLQHLPSIRTLSQYYIRLEKYESAANWLRKAMSAGDLEAQMTLADLYFQGPGQFNKDLQKAHDYYLSAAKQGHGSSQLRLGIVYYKGLGVKQNMIEAYKWLRISTIEGNSEAKPYLEAELLPKMTNTDIAQGKMALEKYIANK